MVDYENQHEQIVLEILKINKRLNKIDSKQDILRFYEHNSTTHTLLHDIFGNKHYSDLVCRRGVQRGIISVDNHVNKFDFKISE